MCNLVHVCIGTAPLAITNAVTGGGEEWPCCDKLLFLSHSSQCGAPPLRHTPLLFTITWMATNTDIWCTKTCCKQEDSAFFIEGENVIFTFEFPNLDGKMPWRVGMCVNTIPYKTNLCNAHSLCYVHLEGNLIPILIHKTDHFVFPSRYYNS